MMAYFDAVEIFHLNWIFIELPLEYDDKLDEIWNLPEIRKLWNQ